MEEEKKKKGPEATLREFGKGIKASIWANETNWGLSRAASICKSVEKDGEFKDVYRFTKDELPFVEKAAAEAYAYIVTKAREERAGGEGV
jgi:hypothetical protein